jgi:hypothetical protein
VRGRVGCLAGQGGGLELGQGLGAALDRGAGLGAAGGGEVVTGGDLGQPGAEPVQVGLGLLDLGIGRAATVALVGQLAFQFGEALQQLGVLGVPGRLEVGDHRRLLGWLGQHDPQQAGAAAVAVHAINQAAHGPGDLGPIGEQADRLLQVQGAKRAQPPPHLGAQRCWRPRRGDRDQQPPQRGWPGRSLVGWRLACHASLLGSAARCAECHWSSTALLQV